MSDTPPRPVPPAQLGELVVTGNPGFDPLPSPPGSDQSTVANAGPKSPTVPDLPSIPGYEILEKIGEGGMGSVYRARKVMLDREVALKTMRPEVAAQAESRGRFMREAKAVARVTVEHDNIIKIWHVDVAADGTPFIELEFLRGEPLDVRLKREPVAPLEFILKVAREVSYGLAAAHAVGLVHRDIKPSNVWLEGDPADVGRRFRRCKILDFGLARLTGKEDAELTRTGAVLGTPAYMSPEQARGHPVDARTDLFSLGVMLYRMATGAPPFTGSSVTDVMFAIANDTPRSVRALASDLPPELLDLIERLMSKNVSGRPASAAEVAATVAAIERHVSEVAPESLSLPRGPIFRPDGSGTGIERATSSWLERPKPRPNRDRLTELAGAVALMPIVTAACAAVWLAAAPAATWTQAGRTFLLATAVAWAVALVCQVPARAGWRRWGRYAIQIAVGIGIAALALWCDGWAPGGAAAAAGVQYAVYFGLAVSAGRWWWERLCDVAAGRPAPGPPGLTWWRVLFTPLTAAALVLVWPSQHAPMELGAVTLAAALLAQVARPLSRVPGAA